MCNGVTDYVVGALLVVDLKTQDVGYKFVNLVSALARGLVSKLGDDHDELATEYQ